MPWAISVIKLITESSKYIMSNITLYTKINAVLAGDGYDRCGDFAMDNFIVDVIEDAAANDQEIHSDRPPRYPRLETVRIEHCGHMLEVMLAPYCGAGYWRSVTIEIPPPKCQGQRPPPTMSKQDINAVQVGDYLALTISYFRNDELIKQLKVYRTMRDGVFLDEIAKAENDFDLAEILAGLPLQMLLDYPLFGPRVNKSYSCGDDDVERYPGCRHLVSYDNITPGSGEMSEIITIREQDIARYCKPSVMSRAGSLLVIPFSGVTAAVAKKIAEILDGGEHLTLQNRGVRYNSMSGLKMNEMALCLDILQYLGVSFDLYEDM